MAKHAGKAEDDWQSRDSSGNPVGIGEPLDEETLQDKADNFDRNDNSTWKRDK